MLFSEALKELEAGKQVVREGWNKDFGYLTLLPGAPYIWRVSICGDKVNAGGYPFVVEDYNANDWKVWKDEKSLNELSDAA